MQRPLVYHRMDSLPYIIRCKTKGL